jgi:hypothetical protein
MSVATVLFRVPHPPVETGLIVSALAALLLCTAVYLLDRDWTSAMFLESFVYYQWSRSAIFGALGGFLPSLMHAYAIPVLIMVALRPWAWTRPWVCLLWFMMASFLEWLQSDSAGALFLATYTPPCDVPLIGYLERYALLGQFDYADLLATGIGCLTALAVTITIKPHRQRTLA